VNYKKNNKKGPIYETPCIYEGPAVVFKPQGPERSMIRPWA